MNSKTISKIIIPIIILIILIFCFKSFFFSTEEQQTFVLVQSPKIGNIECKVDAKGIVKAENPDIMLAYYPIRIEKVLVEKGDVVKKGTPILVGSSTVESGGTSDFQASENGVISKIAKVGECFDKTSSEPLAEIIDLSKLVIESQVSETDITKVKVGDSVEITGDTVKGSLEGKVFKISSVAENTVSENKNAQIAYVGVKVTFDNKNHTLKPDYNVNIAITTDSAKDVMTIPKTAIESEKGQDFVYVLDSNNVVRKKNVKVGLQSTYEVQINGLNKSDRVITTISEDLKEGMKLKPEEIKIEK